MTPGQAPPGTEASGTAIYRRLLGYAAEHRALAALAVAGMVVEAAAAGAFTALMNPLVDQTFVEKNPMAALWLPFAIVALFVARGIATFVTDYGMARVGRGVVQTLREQVLAKYLRMPSRWFDARPTASLVSRLTYNTEQVAQAASDAVKVAITDLCTLIALLTVMLMQSVRVTIAMLVMGPLIAAIVAVVGRRYRRINTRIQSSVGELSQIAEEALAAQPVVKVYGGQPRELARFRAVAERNRRLQVKVEATKAASSSLVQLLSAIALAVIVYVAGREAMAGRLTPGGFVSLMTAMMAMLPSLKRITTVQGMIQKGIAAASGLFEVLDAEEERDDGTRAIGRSRGQVAYEGVVVRYADDKPPALDGVDLVAEPGTVTAIVGRSGSGKSTLVRLLPRLYEADAGVVRVDGEPVGSYRLADLRRQVALVSQDVLLFDDTVAANIAYGMDGDVPMERLREAASAANALDFIERLPQGFETRIGEGGALLSGGQRQRLAIARALLKDAPILILDEATSSLDTESERLIQDALERIMRGRTTLVIAHRLSTVEHADQILVLDHGRIVERGTHAALIARDGAYRRLHGLQFRDT
jgi:subfamily B ATP-binding cassette protein MsbA